MKPAPFVHHAPRTVDEAVAVLAEVGHDGKVLAGGQSLIPVLNMRLASPAHLVDINGVAGLDAIDVTDDCVRVGALVRHAAARARRRRVCRAAASAPGARNVAHPAIRNRGTTVGSIAHADAAGEMPSVLVLTDGVVEVVGPQGRREIAAADFFEGPLETALRPTSSSRPCASAASRAARAPRSSSPPAATATTPWPVWGGRRPRGRGATRSCERARASFVSVTDVPRRPRPHRSVRARTRCAVELATAVDELVAGHVDPGGRHPRQRRLPPDARRRAHPTSP